MAGHSSLYYDQKIIDHSTGVAVWTPLATRYVALTTVVLTRTDVTIPSGVEMVGLGYGRAQITSDVSFWSAAAVDVASGSMMASNIVAVTFANATSDWPALPGWAVVDAPIGGNVLWSGAFDDQVGLVSSGQTPVIAAGSLQLAVAGAA